jgi:hypothetical protein
MSVVIENIYLSNAHDKIENPHADEGETGVIVASTNGEKFYAYFLSFDHLATINRQHVKSGEFMSGHYFWSKNLVLVKNCAMSTIEGVVNDLIEDGDFQEAFLKL